MQQVPPLHGAGSLQWKGRRQYDWFQRRRRNCHLGAPAPELASKLVTEGTGTPNPKTAVVGAGEEPPQEGRERPQPPEAEPGPHEPQEVDVPVHHLRVPEIVTDPFRQNICNLSSGVSQAYVTLATNDGYAIGALVLGHSLRSNATTKELCIMISPTVSSPIRSLLESVFDKVVTVDVLDSEDSAHLSLLKRPELGVTFTKLHCWTLTNYSKCVFLDADMLCVQNPDDLFSHPELTAVCDIGWPDCFNSGMFVFVPSLDTYGKLLQHAETKGSFDGGDQGLLNTAFPNWHRVSFVYNMVASATYTYLPAYKQYGANAKLVHFLGALKPWQHRYDASSGSVHTAPGYEHLALYLNTWWTIYLRLVRPGVPEMVVQQLADISIGQENLHEGLARWERGEPDYLGRDSFANIQAYIEEKLQSSK